MRTGLKLTLGFALGAAFLLAAASCSDEDATRKRVFMLGMDGMDPQVLDPLLAAGRMPNFAKLAKMGGYKPLGTSTPPQSPVAWSNVITGCDSSVHNIFDFIHRDPKGDLPMPYLSTAKEGDPGKPLRLGKWSVPLFGGEGTILFRRGKPFWEYLTEAGIPATVFRMPTQYPPGKSKGADFTCLSGMGTPELRGSYGEFSFYSSNPATIEKSLSGGRRYRLRMTSFDSAKGNLVGPANPLLHVEEKETPPKLKVPFTIDRDPDRPVARLAVQGRTFLLNVGDWTDWVRIEFETGIPGQSWLPGGTIGAVCRFRLNALRPYIELYVTPPDLDPIEASASISEPSDFAKQLAEDTGLFYTQGIPEDHAALSEGALDRDQYLEQVEFVLDERMRHLDYMLKRYAGGFFFFYVGTTDQVAHMFWAEADPGHARYDEKLAERYGQTINKVYERADVALGKVMEAAREGDTIMVMSDHGFNDFSRGFNLNTWLLQNGYITLRGRLPQDKYEMFVDVDWSRTKAYNLGINCLYLNLRGREKNGSVDPLERDQLLDEIAAKLKQVRDPENGEQVIVEVYRVDRVYPGADPEIAPDLLIGYNRGYRASWGTILGKMPYELIEDNTNRWSGDHCVATHLVPGIIIANRPIVLEDPTLLDLAPTVLAEYGIAQPTQMKGRNLFGG